MNNIQLTEDEGKEIVSSSYKYYKNNDYLNALKILKPIIEENKTVKSEIFSTSLLWAIAGDSYCKLNEVDLTIDAYRKSIDYDQYSSAIPNYAHTVAKHGLVGEATNAYEKLTEFENDLSNNPKKYKVFAFIFAILFDTKTWWQLYANPKLVKRQLCLLTKRQQNF